MSNTLRVEVRNTLQYLAEATLDFARRHVPFLDSRIQITTWAEFHNFAPVLVLVLNKIDGLDNVNVMQGRRYTKFSCELLHIFLLRLVLTPLSELLQVIVG